MSTAAGWRCDRKAGRRFRFSRSGPFCTRADPPRSHSVVTVFESRARPVRRLMFPLEEWEFRIDDGRNVLWRCELAGAPTVATPRSFRSRI